MINSLARFQLDYTFVVVQYKADDADALTHLIGSILDVCPAKSFSHGLACPVNRINTTLTQECNNVSAR